LLSASDFSFSIEEVFPCETMTETGLGEEVLPTPAKRPRPLGPESGLKIDFGGGAERSHLASSYKGAQREAGVNPWEDGAGLEEEWAGQDDDRELMDFASSFEFGLSPRLSAASSGGLYPSSTPLFTLSPRLSQARTDDGVPHDEQGPAKRLHLNVCSLLVGDLQLGNRSDGPSTAPHRKKRGSGVKPLAGSPFSPPSADDGGTAKKKKKKRGFENCRSRSRMRDEM